MMTIFLMITSMGMGMDMTIGTSMAMGMTTGMDDMAMATMAKGDLVLLRLKPRIR